jgi:hypothetical protein
MLGEQQGSAPLHRLHRPSRRTRLDCTANRQEQCGALLWCRRIGAPMLIAQQPINSVLSCQPTMLHDRLGGDLGEP